MRGLTATSNARCMILRGAMLRGAMLRGLLLCALATLAACSGEPDRPAAPKHGPYGEGVAATSMGGIVGFATDAQRDSFERGKAISLHRFGPAEGLGPGFNVTFCAACHEKPTIGGSAGLYRSFFIAGERLEDGTFLPADSVGSDGGVIRLYDVRHDMPARPYVPSGVNHVVQRNAIPFFGVGLLSEIPDEEILRRADPDDRDGDGISGRANYASGKLGRFGRKAQAPSIEGFIRGPLFNHQGLTTDPLTPEHRAALPMKTPDQQQAAWVLEQREAMQTAAAETTEAAETTAADRSPSAVRAALEAFAQVSAPDSPLIDEDTIADPEIGGDDLFDLVSFALLLGAPPVVAEPTGAALAGRDRFDELGCGGCHTPRLEGPRGPVPAYSDLLIHDMGDALGDGLGQGLAKGNEFRTQPLWGISAVGPFLHDGRAHTLREAIELHGGEAQRARDKAAAMDEAGWAELLAFLDSLGGAAQASGGLIPPDEPTPEAGTWGGPAAPLNDAEAERFEAGRRLFDHEFGFSDGIGGPRFNGDSCRACHFEPVVGGSGPRGVDVIRHGWLDPSGEFHAPVVGTVLHRQTALRDHANAAQPEATLFERRQTPSLLGLGLLDFVPEEHIVGRADPDDLLLPDGISGRAARVDGGRLGRFGWKAAIPTMAEFVRDAVTMELGMTLPWVEGMTFGRVHDSDDVPDPEFSLQDADTLLFYLQHLGPPPPDIAAREAMPELMAAGEAAFATAGCDACHVPSLPLDETGTAMNGGLATIWPYTDLLLHTVLPTDRLGTEEGAAAPGELRTAPLWGVGHTGPWLHDGSAATLQGAILAHDVEARPSRDAFVALSTDNRAALLAWLETL